MAQVFFHCSSTTHAILDQRGQHIDNLMEAREHAACMVQKCLAAPTLEGWREWTLHVSDVDGREILSLPFASLLGRAH
jgi:hypothetical protein